MLMTDQEYISFLKALAGKHLRPAPKPPVAKDIKEELEQISAIARTWKIVADRRGKDEGLLRGLCEQLEQFRLEEVRKQMDEVGILDALDDVPSLVFGQFRRSVIPGEDIDVLRQAGFSNDDVEVLLAVALEHARFLAGAIENAYVLYGKHPLQPSNIVTEAEEALQKAIKSLSSRSTRAEEPSSRSKSVKPEKKGKLLNGIGKLLGGALAGAGNVLLLTGTLVAPNPATGYGAIASGGLAVSSFLAGLGDLRGE